MQKIILLLTIAAGFFTLPSQAWWIVSANSAVASAPVPASEEDKAHNAWLKERFSEQHKQLIPVVAVADMFISCNKARKVDSVNYELSHLVNNMDRETLATKLEGCLDGDTIQSDVALNFGLEGCFHEQLAHLPEEERKLNMQRVKSAIVGLSHAERKKSFTQCVTEQSIQYLK